MVLKRMRGILTLKTVWWKSGKGCMGCRVSSGGMALLHKKCHVDDDITFPELKSLVESSLVTKDQ